MTNFDFLLKEPKFNAFADVAISAEKLINIDISACVLNCRRAMEFAVKWMYSVDSSLVMPYQDALASLLSTEEFRDIVGQDILYRLDFIRKVGNNVAHSSKKVSLDQAKLCLLNLFVFLDFVAYCYADDYSANKYDASLLNSNSDKPVKSFDDIDFATLLEENKQLKEQLTSRRKEQKESYSPTPLERTEYDTRKIYIDTVLQELGWVEGRNWLNEVELFGMPNKEGVGYADYVLYGDDGRALAVIEAKRTCRDVAEGRQQAKLYADILEKKYNRRPVIFLSNGFETRIIDGCYPERKVATIYSKRDLEKLFNLRTMRTSLKNIVVNQKIAGRYYQQAAIKAVCNSFGEKNRRKALLVMATGSGKTRTVIALVDVLLKHGWIKNVLFLADRNALVTQAKRSFVNNLPDLSVTNLCEEKDNFNAHCVFSTYQTMTNCIDEIQDEDGKLFTSGHFDLIIVDEAHRSIYNKYQDIFNYFDAPLVGLTATPKDEIDKNTYSIFELESGVPTYGYELAQAVKDGYLVDYMSVETSLKFVQQGIVYDELSDEDKEMYENTFEQEDGDIPDKIASSAINDWVFNEDTIRKALHILMTEGLRVDYGETLGKTIIFAKNHRHAEKILEIFGKEYPSLVGYAKVIDNKTEYAQSAIDEFSVADKLPRIAISVDMLDTGIDIPEILNLVFFKKVMSKAKFWQMIGRGTRRCDGLIDGKDKEKFYIFDLCGNFEFFRTNEGKPSANQMALQSAIFFLKTQIVYKLQDISYQTEPLIELRKRLVTELVSKVSALNRDNFAVRQHIKYVDKYSKEEGFKALDYEDTLIIREELAPLILPDNDNASAVRFDALLYGIELAYLAGKKFSKAKNDLYKKVNAIAGVANIPEIMMQSQLIEKILHTDYIENADVNDFEHIRTQLRDLMKYIPKTSIEYTTDFADDILSVEWRQSELENDDLKNYKAKAEFYIRQHQGDKAIAKLKGNIPLDQNDIEELEKALWGEIGTKEEYEAEYGKKPLGEFVRSIVGLDMNAAKEAFNMFLKDVNLDDRQIYFVNQIIEYIVRNGVMKDLSVLQESPFTDKGSVVELFANMAIWASIRKAIDYINANAAA